MGVFCTVQDIRDFLQVEVDEAAAMRAIVEATAAIKNYCKQQIELVEDDEYTFDVTARQTKLFLPELPVVEVQKVVEDGELLVAGTDYQLGRNGILYRIGDYWTSGVQAVEATYTHGYEADDPELQNAVDVATRAASRAYQAGLRSESSEGVPGVAAKQLGDYSVQFSGETGGGISEGVLGASASRMLLLSEKDMLNKYRLKGP